MSKIREWFEHNYDNVVAKSTYPKTYENAKQLGQVRRNRRDYADRWEYVFFNILNEGAQFKILANAKTAFSRSRRRMPNDDQANQKKELHYSEFWNTLILRAFPFFNPPTSEAPFWITLRTPNRKQRQAMFQEWTNTGKLDIPVFSDEQNENLKTIAGRGNTAGDSIKEELDETFRKYISEFQRKIFRTFLVTSKASNAQYRLKSNLGHGIQNVYKAHPFRNASSVKIVKWDDRGFKEPLRNWNRARNSGMKILEFSTTYELYAGRKVLVMERLESLQKGDNPLDMFAQIMRQLQTLHNNQGRGLLAHSDIKPPNIMKKTTGNKAEYYLIDFDILSHEASPIPDTVDRLAYTPLWTSQMPAGGIPTSYRYDLMELYYSANDMYRINNGELPAEQIQEKGEFQNARLAVQTLKIREHSYIFWLISELPERNASGAIDYQSIIDYLENRIEAESQPTINSNMEEKVECYGCASNFPVSETIQARKWNGKEKYACGKVCAGKFDDEYAEHTIRHAEVNTTVFPYGYCKECSKPTEQKCDNCNSMLCSYACFEKHEPFHEFDE